VHDAEDVTAGAFLELWRRRKSVRIVDGSVLPWLLITTTNLARNLSRSLRRYRALIDSLPRSDSTRSAGEVALERVEVTVLAEQAGKALASLAKSDAALITLTAVEHYSPAQAAAALGISEDAARTRLHRARTRMAAALGAFVAESDTVSTKELDR
jgi:RNA polymerase sigma-70 factor (ECF subfamily)